MLLYVKREKIIKVTKNEVRLTCLPPLLRLVCVAVTVFPCDLVFLCQVFGCDAHWDFDMQVG